MSKKMRGSSSGPVPPVGSIVSVDMPGSERPAYGHVADRSADGRSGDVQLTEDSRARHGEAQGLQLNVDKGRIREM